MTKDADRNEKPRRGLSRRGFLGTAGAGVVGAAVAGAAQPGAQKPPVTGPVNITLIVNGRQHSVEVEPQWTLLHVLREELGLSAAKPGCERGECGACTVLIDGHARYSCMALAVEAENREITTVEGLMIGEKAGPVQMAFVEEDGFQCGYCTPGQVMAAEALLRRNADPSLEEIRVAMSGNLCRCGAYEHIFKSVKRAAALRKAGNV